MRGPGGTSPLRRSLTAAAALLALSLGLAACGERQFEADSLIDELNGAGADLQLGETLPDTGEGVDVRVVYFADPEPGVGVSTTEEVGAGAVVVLDDTEAASTEFERCESAVEFVCFRAANAVLRFSGISPEQQDRLTSALRELETSD